MTNKKKLSLFSVILININIMLGSGIFVNTVLLSKLTGSLSPLSYIIVGILLLPLILAIVKLWGSIDSGATFYHLGLPISPFFGFLSSWSYFIGKISTLVLGIHVCFSLLQQIIPELQSIPILLLDAITIFIFTIFNLLNLRTGSTIQYGFIIFKLVPIIFTIFSGFYLFSKANFNSELLIPSGIPASITLVFFAFAGFEASCSLSQSIENPKKNGPKAILISYIIVVIIATLFQFMLCGNLGKELYSLTNGYLEVFPTLIAKLSNFFQNNKIKHISIVLLNLGIAASSLGAAYGVMFSNSWNLYNLAQSNHLFMSKIFTLLNKHHIPYVCIITEGLIAIIYLLITQAQQIPLQQVGALGATISYTISTLSLLILSIDKRQKTNIKIAIFSLISCLILLSAFIFNLSVYGISNLLILFIFLQIIGCYMFYKKHKLGNLEIYQDL
ncbi:APC family permease [Candidatus Babela massiliensis]|uniref:Amino acid transporter n=1 Tax=Candidatus Babela massiliensis TaxID=673862 RepID=V6DI15_9BACT|nr:APC family permease [Candidatus Babela massiliensis]CDK30573.1 Amino acid transporter [Candidatus Babela massiliensis]